ncbi:MAG: PTS sugar transporter subunit IIC [Gemmatimonadaceae bacterium]|nr:PTS sugar transporter subunit IIC [Gemmatimonadaceae bacterium]
MIAELLVLAMVGAICGLDVVSFPQAALSRPLVACTIAGALLGDAVAGLVCGAVLELFASETLPFGASRYPEWGSSSVVAGAAAAAGSRAGELPLALCVAIPIGLALAAFGGWTMVKLREWNARLASHRLEALARGSARTVMGLQVAGATADLARAALIALAGSAVALPLARWLAPQPEPHAAWVVPVLAGLGGAVAGGAAWKMYHSTPRTQPWGAAGLVVGLALVYLLAR